MATGAHIADAVDPAPVATSKPFINQKLPQLLQLMSASRRAELGDKSPALP
jgi:hypothetical protein